MLHSRTYEGRPPWGRAVYTALHGARLSSVPSFLEAGAGCTSRAFKHPGCDVTAPDVWPSILTDYTYDSELDNADGVPLAFRRSVSFPRGTRVTYVTWDDLE